MQRELKAMFPSEMMVGEVESGMKWKYWKVKYLKFVFKYSVNVLVTFHH